MSTADQKTFVLGVGAQKAGTTWLHRYLAAHPDVRMSGLKELHYWDAQYRPELSGIYHGRRREELQDKLSRWDRELKRDEALVRATLSRVIMEIDEEEYFRYFAQLSEGVSLVGEITPAYSMLPAETYERIRTKLIEYGFRVRVVFLMRDPIQRIYSSLRMKDRRLDRTKAAKIFVKALTQEQQVERTRYDKTITNLRAAFAPEETYINFYEHFFDERVVQEVCEFLGVSYAPANVGERINASPTTQVLDDEQIRKGLEVLEPVYSFIRREFGDGVPDSWLG